MSSKNSTKSRIDADLDNNISKRKKNVCLLKFKFLYLDEASIAIQNAQRKDTYTVWGIPPVDVVLRIKKLMEALRAEFGGPEIEPHITVVGSVLWRHDDAVKHFVSGCENIEPYLCEVNELVTRKFYYQPVSLLFQPCDWVCLSLSCYSSSCFVLGVKMSHTYYLHFALMFCFF